MDGGTGGGEMIEIGKQKVIDSDYVFYVDDLKIIQRALFLHRDIFVNLDEAAELWQNYSYSLAASWLFLPEELEDIPKQIESGHLFNGWGVDAGEGEISAKFLLFAGHDYYPRGGARDFKGAFMTEGYAMRAHDPTEHDYDGGWANIFDIEKAEIVKQFHGGRWINVDKQIE